MLARLPPCSARMRPWPAVPCADRVRRLRVAARISLTCDGDLHALARLADALTAAFAFFRDLPSGMAAPTVRWELPPAPASTPVADAAALEALAGQQPLTQRQLDRERARLSIPADDLELRGDCRSLENWPWVTLRSRGPPSPHDR